MKKQIPNIITLLNLLCGVLSICFVMEEPVAAAIFIILGAVFDFFDGMTARLLKVSSPIGKELDSLSDVVSFGVAPSLIALHYLSDDFGSFLDSLANLIHVNSLYSVEYLEVLCFIPLLMVLMSSYRLAKFNLDTRQTDNFIGLPTPANAFLWLSIPLIEYAIDNDWYSACNSVSLFIYNTVSSFYFIAIVSLIMSFLLVSEIPMFSLKFHNLSWKDNKVRFIFLILSLVLIGCFNVVALPIIIFMYLIISITYALMKK
ncbi:MAG: CDP-alcohol phosphatidyltransferase family protein [Bacteroidales bacterium]|nr:CDP-alcohol phosphatidyltransferase family protein [Bacteroidales bacterium]